MKCSFTPVIIVPKKRNIHMTPMMWRILRGTAPPAGKWGMPDRHWWRTWPMKVIWKRVFRYISIIVRIMIRPCESWLGRFLTGKAHIYCRQISQFPMLKHPAPPCEGAISVENSPARRRRFLSQKNLHVFPRVDSENKRQKWKVTWASSKDFLPGVGQLCIFWK